MNYSPPLSPEREDMKMSEEKKEKKVEIKSGKSATDKRLDAIEAKLRRFGANWKAYMNQVGRDGVFHDDGKLKGKGSAKIWLVCTLLFVGVVGTLFARDFLVWKDNDSSETAVFTFTMDGDGTGGLAVLGTLSASEAITATGGVAGPIAATTLSASSGLTVSDGLVILTPTSLNVTNGQEITVSDGVYILNGINSPPGGTNTITIAAATLGSKVTLCVNAASTNLIALADSGTLKLTGAFEMGAFDTLTLYAMGTTNLVELARANN